MNNSQYYPTHAWLVNSQRIRNNSWWNPIILVVSVVSVADIPVLPLLGPLKRLKSLKLPSPRPSLGHCRTAAVGGVSARFTSASRSRRSSGDGKTPSSTKTPGGHGHGLPRQVQFVLGYIGIYFVEMLLWTETGMSMNISQHMLTLPGLVILSHIHTWVCKKHTYSQLIPYFWWINQWQKTGTASITSTNLKLWNR